MTGVACEAHRLNAFQLRKFFHQFFYTEPRKLYRNFRVFPVSFAPEDHPFAILWMSHTLPAAKSCFAGRLFHRQLRARKLLSARAKKLRDVVDGTAALSARGGCSCASFCELPGCAGMPALVLIFIAPVRFAAVLRDSLAGRARGLRRVTAPAVRWRRRAQVLNQMA